MRSKKNTLPTIDVARARLVVTAVAMEFSIAETLLTSHKKGTRDVSYARQVAMYLMCCVFSSTKSRVADIFGRHFSTVSHACNVIEEQREDPILDRKLISLENFLRQSPLAEAL